MSTPAHDPNEAFRLRLAEFVAAELVAHGEDKTAGAIIDVLAVVLADTIYCVATCSATRQNASMASVMAEVMRQLVGAAIEDRLRQHAANASRRPSSVRPQ